MMLINTALLRLVCAKKGKGLFSSHNVGPIFFDEPLVYLKVSIGTLPCDFHLHVTSQAVCYRNQVTSKVSEPIK